MIIIIDIKLYQQNSADYSLILIFTQNGYLGLCSIYNLALTVVIIVSLQIKALKNAGVTVTLSPAQMGNTLKKVIPQYFVLTLYTLTSAFKFSTPFSIHLL